MCMCLHTAERVNCQAEAVRQSHNPPPSKSSVQALISTILCHLKRSSIDSHLPTCAQPLTSNVDHFYSLPKIVSDYVRKRPPA